MHCSTALTRFAAAAVLSFGLSFGLPHAAQSAEAAPATAAAPTAFRVEVQGQGRPMILIPGLASSGAVWQATAAHAAGRYQVHVLTLAGFAGMPAIPEPLLPAAEAQLLRYIADQHLDKPIVVGHSLGGWLALKTAADHPDALGPLVIVDALPALGATQMPDITPAQLQAAAARMRQAMQQQDAAAQDASRVATIATMVSSEADRQKVAGWGRASDRRTVVDAMADLMASDLRDDIASIRQPVLVLGSWVAYKQFAPRQAIEAVYRMQYAKLPQARIVLSDAGRHFLMLDDPDWMLAQMDQFLK